MVTCPCNFVTQRFPQLLVACGMLLVSFGFTAFRDLPWVTHTKVFEQKGNTVLLIAIYKLLTYLVHIIDDSLRSSDHI